VEKSMKEKGLALHLDVPEKALVYADKVRVQEIMDNFLTNAVKYTQEGSVAIAVSTDGKSWTVTIKDTGIGMTDESLKLLGSKFFRVAQQEKDDDLAKPGGTGLGL